jgi:1-acyl-sn-glycerol-3-phosphate acyltransferase
MAYAVYPRQLRCMSKEELFGSPLARWILHHGGSVPIDRTNPSLSSIKTAIDILQNGEIILIFPTGTRKAANATAFKRGAATVALHAGVPLVPAFYEGPKNMRMGHIMHRPRIRVTFGAPIPTTELPLGRANVCPHSPARSRDCQTETDRDLRSLSTALTQRTARCHCRKQTLTRTPIQ